MAKRFANWWKKLPRDGLQANSFSAYLFAAACVSVAVIVQALFDAMGGSIPVAAYFPAILLAAIAGGLGAGVFSAALSLAIISRAFGVPAAVQFTDIALFVLSAGAIIGVAELYRTAMQGVHEAERKHNLMLRELEHRGKNTFAIVQSIVSHALHDRTDVATTIIGRIRSVSATNDIITKSEHHTAALHSILERELEPYDRTRTTLIGPDVQLNAELARSLSLIMHELATNAAKYGALCKPDGQLNVEWIVDRGQLQLTWNEINGPTITAPFEPGFGARLVTRLLKNYHGEVTPEFHPDGLRLRIALALPADEKMPARI